MTQATKFDPIVNLAVTVTEANFILASLGSQPYNQVNGLITKIKSQAEEQLSAKPQEVVEPVLVHEPDEMVIPAN